MKKGTRKAKGSGTIRKRKNGKWEARYTIGRDMKGKQIQRSVYGSTQEEVRQKLTAIINSIDLNTYIEPSRTTLCDWLRYWLDEYAKDSTKPHTFDHYVAICENHIIPEIGSVKLQNVTTSQLQRLYKDLLRKKNLSAKTIRNIHAVIHPALQQAVKERILTSNPAEDCVLPRYVKPKIKPLEDDDVRDSKQIIGYMASFTLLNGFTKTVYMTHKQMEEHALKYSNGYRADKKNKTSYTFWSKDFTSMAFKTLLRQLISRWGIMSIELQQAYDSDMAVINEDGTKKYVDNDNETTIIEANEINNQEEKTEKVKNLNEI